MLRKKTDEEEEKQDLKKREENLKKQKIEAVQESRKSYESGK